ncbi:hypothetical protein CLOM_g13630 [Closterium sp. NIES-68]|nr:hypothetical protein CLOM_g13630 [Closterium sp. NIES-68]GJP65091.1 hypothetical protein CLOP_g21997 [Closterium sp. NIES-67]
MALINVLYPPNFLLMAVPWALHLLLSHVRVVLQRNSTLEAQIPLPGNRLKASRAAAASAVGEDENEGERRDDGRGEGTGRGAGAVSRALRATCVVTGATSGLGKEAAAALASLGTFHVVMGCRSLKRGYQAAADITSRHPHASIEIVPLDLSRPASVVRFCEYMRSRLGLEGEAGAARGIGEVEDGKEGSRVRQQEGSEEALTTCELQGEKTFESTQTSEVQDGMEGSRVRQQEESVEALATCELQGGNEGSKEGQGEKKWRGEEAGEEAGEEEEEEAVFWEQTQRATLLQNASPLPPLCLLVNNAGILAATATATHRSASGTLPVDRMLATNYLGPVLLTLRLLPFMGRQNSRQAHGMHSTHTHGEPCIQALRDEPSIQAHREETSIQAHGLERPSRQQELQEQASRGGEGSREAGRSGADSRQQESQGKVSRGGEGSTESESRMSCRVVNVTSFTHRSVRQLYISDVASLAAGAAAPGNTRSPFFYPAARIYQASKLCLLLFSLHLHRLLQSDPSTCHISVVPIDPGMVRTSILRELPAFLSATVNAVFSLLRLLSLPHSLSPLFLRASTAPQVAGQYLFGPHAHPLAPSPLAVDPSLSDTLWQTTQDLLSQWAS